MGELGTPSYLPEATKEETIAIRQPEFAHAMSALGATGMSLSFPDMGLAFVPLETMVKPVLEIARDLNTGTIFSFDMFNIVREVEHPDHRKTGEVALYVADAFNVKHFYPRTDMPSHRPDVFLWTTNTMQPGRLLILPVSEEEHEARINYFLTHYPSQFAKEHRHDAGVIFDRVFSKPRGEVYLHARGHLSELDK